MNIDVKLKRMLANCIICINYINIINIICTNILKLCIKIIVHQDQVEFIPGIEHCFRIKRSVLPDKSRRLKKNYLII